MNLVSSNRFIMLLATTTNALKLSILILILILELIRIIILLIGLHLIGRQTTLNCKSYTKSYIVARLRNVFRLTWVVQ